MAKDGYEMQNLQPRQILRGYSKKTSIGPESCCVKCNQARKWFARLLYGRRKLIGNQNRWKSTVGGRCGNPMLIVAAN